MHLQYKSLIGRCAQYHAEPPLILDYFFSIVTRKHIHICRGAGTLGVSGQLLSGDKEQKWLETSQLVHLYRIPSIAKRRPMPKIDFERLEPF